MEHQGVNTQQELIDKMIWRFLEQNKELVLKKVIGQNGLVITADTNKDINLNTYGTGKVKYNGAEIGAAGGPFLPLGGGTMTGDIVHNAAMGDKYYNSAEGANQAGDIRAFHGDYGYYDFMVRSYGRLYLSGDAGINIQSALAANLDLGGYKITGLGTPSLVNDAARYKDGFFICTSVTRPANPTEGMHIYETDTDKEYKCTVGGATPTWVEVGSGVSDHGALTGLSDDDHTQYSLANGTRDFSNDVSINSAIGGFWGSRVSSTLKAYFGHDGLDGYLVVNSDPLYVKTTGANSIYLQTNSTTRLTVADALITTAVDIVPSASGTLSLGSATAQMAYLYSRNLTVYDSAGANGAYITNIGGNMIIHVKTSGGKVQVVNDA